MQSFDASVKQRDMKSKVKLTHELDRVPPWAVRLMAKNASGLFMSNSEIQQRTGWGRSKIRRLCNATSFGVMSANDIDTFHDACGQSWSAQRQTLWLLKLAFNNGGIHTMRHFRFRTGWQASMIKRHQRRIEKLLSNK